MDRVGPHLMHAFGELHRELGERKGTMQIIQNNMKGHEHYWETKTGSSNLASKLRREILIASELSNRKVILFTPTLLPLRLIKSHWQIEVPLKNRKQPFGC